MIRTKILNYILFAFLISGCTSILETSPIPDSPFLKDVPELIPQTDRFAFQRAWRRKEVEQLGISTSKLEVFVAPVSVEYLQKSNRLRGRSYETIKKDAEEMAELLRSDVQAAIIRQKGRAKLLTYGPPGPDTLELRLAIIELAPLAVGRKTITTLGGFFVPGSSALGIYSDAVIAIEGILFHPSSGQIIAAFADRETGKIAPIDLRIFSKYRQAEENIEAWSEAIATLLNSSLDTHVKKESVFTLKPW